MLQGVGLPLAMLKKRSPPTPCQIHSCSPIIFLLPLRFPSRARAFAPALSEGDAVAAAPSRAAPLTSAQAAEQDVECQSLAGPRHGLGCGRCPRLA